VVHCVSEARARGVLAAIAERMEQVGLRLHPDKTRIVFVSANAGGGGWCSPSCGAVGEMEVGWPSGASLRGAASNRRALRPLTAVRGERSRKSHD
jgi:hypothetical protein